MATFKEHTAAIIANLYGSDGFAADSFTLDGVDYTGAMKPEEVDGGSYEGLTVYRQEIWLGSGQVTLPGIGQEMFLDGVTYTVEHAASDGQLDHIILIRFEA